MSDSFAHRQHIAPDLFQSYIEIIYFRYFKELYTLMKRISLLAVIFVFAAVSAVSAQTATGKTGWVDTGAFADEKEGIKRYLAALTAIGNELKPREQELINIQTRVATIAEDIRKLQNTPPNVPIPAPAIREKQEEGQRLQREFEFKKKEYDAMVEKRSGEVLGPINQDIGKALDEYAKQKGFSAILDIDKLAQAGAILVLDSSVVITKDFITFYNARPATAATAAAPR